jgi:hypothetical protein
LDHPEVVLESEENSDEKKEGQKSGQERNKSLLSFLWHDLRMVSVGNKLVNLCTLRVTHEKADVRWTTGHSAKEDLKTILALGGPYGRKERYNQIVQTRNHVSA